MHTIFGGRNVYGGRGEFHGGDIEVFRGGDRGFFWGGDKVLRGKKTRVQSPESRVQSPGSSLVFRICLKRCSKLKSNYE